MTVPYTRQLAYVLREQLQQTGVSVLIGTVTSVPDPGHVTVSIQGAAVTVPKLTNYTPVVGEPVYILSDPLFTVALGSVKETPPPGISNADTLDGIDSTGFMRSLVTGGRCWFGNFTGTTDGVVGKLSISHSLGVVPTVVLLSVANIVYIPVWITAETTSSVVVTQWYFTSGTTATSASVRGSLLVAA